jgi:hypothetical protein
MKGKKIFFLFLALILPGCIFVFLKMFGENEFDVPLLYQDGVTEIPASCHFSYSAPYAIPDSLMNKISGSNEADLYIINYSTDEAIVNRLTTETRGEGIKVVADSLLSGDPVTTQVIRQCVLLSPETADLVLLDAQKRIRGYYSSVKLDDMDQLLLEIKIILKKY